MPRVYIQASFERGLSTWHIAISLRAGPILVDAATQLAQTPSELTPSLGPNAQHSTTLEDQDLYRAIEYKASALCCRTSPGYHQHNTMIVALPAQY